MVPATFQDTMQMLGMASDREVGDFMSTSTETFFISIREDNNGFSGFDLECFQVGEWKSRSPPFLSESD